MDIRETSTNEEPRSGGAKPPAKVSYTHDAVIDMIIANPAIHQNQLAAMFGYTPAWMSTIMSSDAFKARLANRRAELVDPRIEITLDEKFTALTERSLEVLMDKLSGPASQISDNLALRAAELGAKTKGTGGFAPQQPAGEALLGLASRLVALRGEVYSPAPTTIEGNCHEVQSKAA